MRSLNRNLVAAVLCATATTAWSQILINETFDYADLAGLQAKWGTKTGLSLDTTKGNPLPSGAHDGSAQFHQWIGSTFSVVPTIASPLVLTADIWNSGAASQRNTVGIRTGATPLFEMGSYNSFDNDASGPLSTAGAGIGVRILNFAGTSELSGQKWVKLGENEEGWSRWQAIFTDTGLTVRVDRGIDNTWDIVYNSTGTNAAAAFSDLRFGGPSGLASAGGGFAVDNITLSVVPEPSVAALFALGLSTLLVWSRNRR